MRIRSIILSSRINMERSKILLLQVLHTRRVLHPHPWGNQICSAKRGIAITQLILISLSLELFLSYVFIVKFHGNKYLQIKAI